MLVVNLDKLLPISALKKQLELVPNPKKMLTVLLLMLMEHLILQDQYQQVRNTPNSWSKLKIIWVIINTMKLIKPTSLKS